MAENMMDEDLKTVWAMYILGFKNGQDNNQF